MSGTTICPICSRLYEGYNDYPRDPCTPCWRAGYRVDSCGNISRVDRDPLPANDEDQCFAHAREALRAAAIGALLVAGLTAWTLADAATKRSTAAKNAFKREHPCPANGQHRGPCPGYVIDHIVPLCAGGPDTPANMQWQTIAEAKKKDKAEVAHCRRKAP